MVKKIKTAQEFERWVKSELIKQGETQCSIAKKLGVAPARICDAVKLKPYGKRYVPELIEKLGGNPENFKRVI